MNASVFETTAERASTRNGGRTVVQVAHALGRGEGFTVTILRELQAAGIAVEAEDGTWRLTAEAHRRFRPLVGLEPW